MKIAIPVKTNKDNPAIAPLFGKAKWFAFVENRGITIKANPIPDGKAVIQWFIDEGIDTVIMQEMGVNPYKMIQSHGGIQLYHTGFERILLNDLIKKFADGELEILDEVNMAEIIKQHESRHTHSAQHHGEGHHEHGHHHHH